MGLADLLNIPQLPVPGVNQPLVVPATKPAIITPQLPKAAPVPMALSSTPAPTSLAAQTLGVPHVPITFPKSETLDMLKALAKYAPKGANAGASGGGRSWGTGASGPISSGTAGGWGGYSNGQIPLKALAPIGQGFYMQPTAAAAWRRMSDAARADGVSIGIGQSYRTYAQQHALAQEKGLYSQGGLAATPGTSDHGWGLAVDVTSGEDWLAQHAAQYGFGTIPREPWHWQYGGSLSTPPPKPATPRRATTRPTPRVSRQETNARRGRQT